LEKIWEARFDIRPARRGFDRAGIVVSGGYWALVILAYLVLKLKGADMTAMGALWSLLLTIPSSIFTTGLASIPHNLYQPDPGPLSSSFGTFILLPLISGGVNAVAIYWLVSAFRRWRSRRT
jgi:hypothetical protein